MKRFVFPFYLSLLCCILISGPAVCQGLDKIRSQFPHDDAAYLNLSNHYVITNNNGNIKVVNQVEEVIAYLSANDTRATGGDVYFSSFSTIKNLQAYTETPSGKGKHLKEIKVKTFEPKSAMSGNFYDDEKKMTFTFPGVTNGAITHLSYNKEYSDPRLAGEPFMFSEFVPIMQAELSITFPDNVKVAYSMLGEDTGSIKFATSRSGKNITYSWSARNVPAITYESNAPAVRYYAPHIIFRISSYESNGKEVSLLDNTGSLHDWYLSLLKNLNKTDETELKAIVAKITSGISNDRDKAKAIYQWVQGNINYIAFEDGMGGFVPRDAAKVCTNKYGDCKDMANMLRQMLNYANLDASMALIGTRDLPYTYDQLPTPGVANHMISAVRLDGKTIFLDATGKYIPFGLPSPFIQGKEAMVGINDKEFKVITVPEVDKEVNKKYDSTTVTINGRDLDGMGHTHLAGFQKLTLDYLYYGGSSKNDKDFFEGYLNKGSNKFMLKNEQVTGLSDPDKETDITYQYSIPDLVKSSNDKLYVNLNLNKPLKDDQLDIDKRKHARQFEYKFVDEYKVILPVPAGYSVEYIPEATNFDGKYYGFSLAYQRQGDQIILNKKVYINTLSIDKAGFKDWNDYISRLNKAYKETIVLAKNTVKDPASK